MLRNNDTRTALVLGALITAVGTCFGFFHDHAAGIAVLCTGIALCIVFVAASCSRNKKIDRLSDRIDRILYDDSIVVMDSSEEGDLAVLESEIHKMTIRIREQAHALEKDKLFLGDAIADISHQIRTPLTSINLLVSLLHKEGISDAEKRKHLRGIESNMDRIEWLVSSLLKMSKIDSGTAGFKSEKVNLGKLVKKAADPLLISMELHEQVFDYTSSGRESFTGDINWTQEAIGNILKNCMEHTPDGGHIEVTGSENVLYTELIIEDNGPGFSESDIPHLFERFYKGTNSSSKVSYGIGLALSRMIIVSQNGTIKAENRKSGGARFVIRFYKNEKLLK